MTKNDVFLIVKEIIKEVLPELTDEQVTINNNLKELGANSVDRMEVVTMSLEKLNLDIPLIKLSGVSNIEGLVDIFTENL